MADYKFDRTVFKMQTFAEADKANLFDKNVSYYERLCEAWFLISQVYGFPLSDPPKFDRTLFSTRKMNH